MGNRVAVMREKESVGWCEQQMLRLGRITAKYLADDNWRWAEQDILVLIGRGRARELILRDLLLLE